MRTQREYEDMKMFTTTAIDKDEIGRAERSIREIEQQRTSRRTN